MSKRDQAAGHPPGVVAIVTVPDGGVPATEADFETGGAAGLTREGARTFRAERAVKWAAVNRLCHPDVAASLEAYEVERIAEGLIRKKGYRLTVATVAAREPAPADTP